MQYILTRNENGTYTVTDGEDTYTLSSQREALELFAELAEKNGGDDKQYG